MSVSEMVTAASKPIEKLIDAVTGAIGKAYEPRHIRKMADAKAYQLRVIGDELRNNADLPIIYETNGEFSVDISDYEALVNRAGKRIAFQEIEKQENIEAIVDSAYDSLQGVTEIADGEISREWMHRFIDAAGDISTEELQKLWSKVLAGEVLEPNSFSLRTLECLRNMDSRDAKLFERLCSLMVSNSFIINDKDFLRNHGMYYAHILVMDECGLIQAGGIFSEFDIADEPKIVIDFGNYVLIAKKLGTPCKMQIPKFPLTMAGRELSKIVDCSTSDEIVNEICLITARRNPGINLSLHEVLDRKDNKVNYSLKEIPFVSEIMQ